MKLGKRDFFILRKIAIRCDKILATLVKIDYNRDIFVQNTNDTDSIAFCLGQIGELAKKLSTEYIESDSPKTWKSICGLRDIIVHDYDSIDLGKLWEISTVDVRELAIRVQSKILNCDVSDKDLGKNITNEFK